MDGTSVNEKLSDDLRILNQPISCDVVELEAGDIAEMVFGIHLGTSTY